MGCYTTEIFLRVILKQYMYVVPLDCEKGTGKCACDAYASCMTDSIQEFISYLADWNQKMYFQSYFSFASSLINLRIVLTILNEKRFVCSVTTQTRAKRDDSHLRKLHGFHQHEMCKHYTLYRNTLYNCLLILVYKDAIKYFIIKCIGNFNFLKITPSRDIISCVVVAFSIYECLMLIPCNVL